MSTSSPKLLITGGEGQLAQSLATTSFSTRPILLSKNELDITNLSLVAKILNTHRPAVVINTAAFTAVDQAECNKALTHRVNYLGAKNMALACARADVPLIHISTDYVFNGQQTRAYSEEDLPQPINEYGYSKYLGEEAIRQYCVRHVILRVSGLFSEYGNNFIKTILKLATQRETLNIVDDQITCPTYAGDVAKTILSIANTLQCFGTYHYCSTPPVSWYQFAQQLLSIAKQARFNLVTQSINAISTGQYQTAAKRPAFSALACGKIAKDYQIHQPDWQAALNKIIPRLKQ